MSVPFRVDTLLSDTDKRELGRLIASRAWTLDGLLEWLGERGYEISRSALHRYSVTVRKAGERLRQSREITQALARELGDSAAQGQQGRVLVEMARSFVFDLLLRLQDQEAGDGIGPKEIAFIGKGLAELARAGRFDQDFEVKVEAMRRQMAEEAAEAAVEEVRTAGGLSADAEERIRARILGLAR